MIHFDEDVFIRTTKTITSGTFFKRLVKNTEVEIIDDALDSSGFQIIKIRMNDGNEGWTRRVQTTNKGKKMPKLKNTPVTRKFLLNLADSIYNKKTRKFLRLCSGTLQNGPDPKNPNRPMHCGLGELYFAMTGVQPEDTGVNEDDVVDLAFDRSILAVTKAKQTAAVEDELRNLKNYIRKLKLPEEFKQAVLEVIDDCESESDDDPDREPFKNILNEIPCVNDSDCGDESCDYDTYRTRARRVAEKLRGAAMLLPR
jgi:hypothetical protein